MKDVLEELQEKRIEKKERALPKFSVPFRIFRALLKFLGMKRLSKELGEMAIQEAYAKKMDREAKNGIRVYWAQNSRPAPCWRGGW